MKKTYMNPTLEVVVLKFNNSLLAGSPGPDVVNGSTSNEADLLGRDLDFDDEEY